MGVGTGVEDGAYVLCACGIRFLGNGGDREKESEQFGGINN